MIVHRWTGLAIGVFVVIVASTGAVLPFIGEIGNLVLQPSERGHVTSLRDSRPPRVRRPKVEISHSVIPAAPVGATVRINR